MTTGPSDPYGGGQQAPPPGWGQPGPPPGWQPPPGTPGGYAPAPYPPGYGYSPYGGMPPQPSNGLGTAAMVLGILAVVFGLIPPTFWLGWILGILAVIFGAIGRGKAKRQEATNGGAATAGLITGVIGIIAGTVWVVLLFAFVHEVTGVSVRAECRAERKTLEVAEEAYRATHERYATEAQLVSGGFLAAESPLLDVELAGSSYRVVPSDGFCD